MMISVIITLIKVEVFTNTILFCLWVNWKLAFYVGESIKKLVEFSLTSLSCHYRSKNIKHVHGFKGCHSFAKGLP